MIFGFVIDLGVCALFLVLGWLIWKKQKITLIHDYHYGNVKEADIPAYSRLVGMGMILMGAGIGISGLFMLLESALWWLPLVLGFVSGIIAMNKAQKKYNGSWFS